MKINKRKFKLGDILDPQGNTNMVGQVKIRDIIGNTVKFTDSEGTDYQGISQSQVRILVNAGSWKMIKEVV